MKKQINVVPALVLFSASAAQAQQAVQWRVEDGGNGHWYQHVSHVLDWASARDAAEVVGGHLATTMDAGENSFIAHLVTSHEAWIGGFQLGDSCEPGCNWQWVTGEPWTFAAWAPGEPNDWGSGEDGVMLWPSGPWNDGMIWVHATYVIEWSADCNADGAVDYGQILEGSLADVNADGIPDQCQAPCVPMDLNNDRSVDGVDLGLLLSAWGPSGSEPTRADINGNGFVDGLDLGVLLGNWGPCGEAPPWATVLQWQPDPAVVTDGQLRSAIAATGLPWRVRDTATQVEMLLVPPGTFQMGCIMGSNQYGC